MDFGNLLTMMPTLDSRPDLRLTSSQLQYVDQEEGYVEPPLEQLRPIDWADTGLLLITAPAATGKSALARHLAYKTGAPLWDLSGVPVGSRTLVGTLVDFFGPENLVRFVGSQESKGDMLLIIDALDEAHLLAGDTFFEAFMRDVITRLASPLGRARVIVLARQETSTYIELLLNDIGTPFAHISVEYFREDQAQRFVIEYARFRAAASGRPSLPDSHQRWFSNSLNAIFETVSAELSGQSAWSDDRVRVFLGYAPVLQAITDYIIGFEDDAEKETTPRWHLADTTAASTVAKSWQLLERISLNVLVREQEKFLRAAKPQLEPATGVYGWNSWENLYTAAEQVRRVVTWVYSGDLGNPFDTGLPAALLHRYQDIADSWIPQHAFVGESGESGRSFANAVFADYSAAQVIEGGDEELKVLQRQALEAPGRLPTPMLARFLLSGARQREIAVDALDLPVLYDSLLERRGEEGMPLAILESSEEDREYADLTITAGNIDSSFVLFGCGLGLWFRRRLTEASVAFNGTIRLGDRHMSFMLGPNVDLLCDRIAVASNVLRVAAKPDVALKTGFIEGAAGYTRVEKLDDGSFTIACPRLSDPWKRYAEEAPPENGSDAQAAFYLGRIIRRFSGSIGGLRRGRLLIDNVAVGQNSMAQDMLRFLKEVEIVTIPHRKFYELNQTRLAANGISFADASGRALTPGNEQFIRRFLSWRQGL